jgi:hypothetical protein
MEDFTMDADAALTTQHLELVRDSRGLKSTWEISEE